MLHISPETLRRYPLIGVVLGFATAAVIAYLLMTGMTEARQLLAQKAPLAVTLREAVRQSDIRWVTLAQGEWHCDRAVTIERHAGIARWVLGAVESTEIPITDGAGDEVVVACFDGALSCEKRAGAPLTGVIGSTEIFTSRATARRWSRNGDRVVVLNVGASPRYALAMLVGLVAIAILGLGFGTFHLARMLPRTERREVTGAAYVPLEPR